MLSFAVKQGPLIFTFVPPNIIPDRGDMVRDPVKYEEADECNVRVAYNQKNGTGVSIAVRDDRNFFKELFRRRVAPPYRRSQSRESKKIGEEKLMIVRPLNVVNVCGSSHIWIIFSKTTHFVEQGQCNLQHFCASQ